mgnify:CR=1 FL=1
MTTAMNKKTVDYDYVNNREYNRNKRAANVRRNKNARRNRCILLCIIIVIALMMVLKIGGWINKIISRELVVDHYVSYVVKDGDTLSSIASRFDMTDSNDYRFEMHAIIEANDDINGDGDIRHGQTILIPIYKYSLKDDCMYTEK